MRSNFEYRKTTRGACCSCCNEAIEKNEEYSNCFSGHRSKQGTIFICDKCVQVMYQNIPASEDHLEAMRIIKEASEVLKENK